MDKNVFQLICFLGLIAINYSAEYETKHPDDQLAYDLIGLLTKTSRRLQNSLLLKELNPLDNLQFRSVGEDFEFNPTGNLLLNSNKCLNDIIYTFWNIKSEWALKLVDSYGKPESGILLGNVRWLGDYKECVGIRATNPNSSTIGNFKGKYCSLSWSLSLLNSSLPFTFVTGICVPDSCSAEILQEDALQLLQMAGVFPVMNNSESLSANNTLKCKPTERHLNDGAIVMLALLSIFFAMTVLGSSITVVKYFMKMLKESTRPSACDIYEGSPAVIGEENSLPYKHGASDNKALLRDGDLTSKTNVCLQKLETFFCCFCVFKNGAKILNTDSSEGELLCIHGIRFLSMSWVILGHTYIFGFGQMKNILEIQGLVNNFPFQAILQAFFSVDSFFVLSGFLLAYLSMKEFSKRKGEISWPYFYIHRYLRLTPMYMILLGFSATVYFYLGSGPYWPDGDFDPACRNVWWRNLLYINNFDLEAGQCMGWSWYLANDMQFFIISPLFLITLWRWPKIGYSLLGIFLCATFLSNFFITYHFDQVSGIVTFLNGGTMDYEQAMQKFADYFTKLYVKPYTRIGPYLVGILAGYILFRRKTSNAPKHSLIFLTVGWAIATTVTLATVYGLYQQQPGLIARSIYNALSRSCFAAGLSWVIYVCLVGQGGFINSLLSFKLFIPLSRLTYAAYLIHPMIISGYFGTLKTSLEFTHPTIVVLFLGFMIVTYALALPVALILESPIVSLEKLIRKSFVKENTGTVN